MTELPELPPLPEPALLLGPRGVLVVGERPANSKIGFTAEQMEAYGQACAREAREQAATRIEAAALERLKYHWHEADPELPDDTPAWEGFPPDVDCDTCIEVLVVPVSAIREGMK